MDRYVTFDELRASLSPDDTRWNFLDGMVFNLADGSSVSVRVFQSKWSITFEIDSSRRLNLAETSNRLKGARIPVDPVRIEKSGEQDWISLRALSKNEKERAATTHMLLRDKAKQAISKAVRRAKVRDEQTIKKVALNLQHRAVDRQFEPLRQKHEQKRAEVLEQKLQTVMSVLSPVIPSGFEISIEMAELLYQAIDMSEPPQQFIGFRHWEPDSWAADAIWWNFQYSVEGNIGYLTAATSRWRYAGYPEIAEEISRKAPYLDQRNAPNVRFLLLARAGALMDCHTKKAQDLKIVIEALWCAILAHSVDSEDPEAHLQMHRGYNLLGKTRNAIEALRTACDLLFPNRGGLLDEEYPYEYETLLNELAISWSEVRDNPEYDDTFMSSARVPVEVFDHYLIHSPWAPDALTGKVYTPGIDYD